LPVRNDESANPAPADQVRWRLLPTIEARSAKRSSNAFVISRVGWGRTIAYNQTNTRALLSTLIEACASERCGLAISNEEQSDV
jgi:hypothetical protein